jgi:homoserine O-acetyltransferase
MENGIKMTLLTPSYTNSTIDDERISKAVQIIQLPEPFKFYRDGTLSQVQMAYETWGELSKDKDNVVLLFTGLSPSSHACSSLIDPTPGWWEMMIGAGKPIDTNKFYVVCINSLGSCFGSTGPSSINPDTAEPYRLNFPPLSIEDIATAGRSAMQILGIQKIHTIVGLSLGGMTALAYAIRYPDEVKNLILVSAAAQATSFAIAIRSLQRELIKSDPAWQSGNYPKSKGPIMGMHLARKLGLISYRSAQEWQERFGRERIASHHQSSPFDFEFEIESYIDHNAQKFIHHFDANSYLYLSRAIDWFDVAEYGGSVEAGLAKIRAQNNLVIGVETDILYPLAQQQEIARGLEKAGRHVEFVPLPSVQGHDAFLIDEDRFCPVIESFFNRF